MFDSGLGSDGLGYKKQLGGIFRIKVVNAVDSRDHVAVVRFIKLYSLIGLDYEGLEEYVKSLKKVIAMRSRVEFEQLVRYHEGVIIQNEAKLVGKGLNQKEDVASALVKGKAFQSSVQGFNNLLRASHSGIMIGLKSTHTLFDKKEALILIGFSEKQVALKSKDLNAEHKFLHYIVTSCLVQRTRNYDRVTPLDLMVMYIILKKKQINLGYLVLTQIKKHHDQPQKFLPYGIFITRICKKMSINFEGESLLGKHVDDKCSEKVLCGMGLKLVNGKWK
ncbi:hypothetical protein LIER_23379 [Lithospermum erythrorhizon]|uniref:Putative plant transposon protein domain-containing protein n=1 Tax=Lithospermum erythrorhizon TaxID=34254 RepID=A0AAV3QX68_LITER